MAKTALFYRKLENSCVQCRLCPNNCYIKPNCVGICRVRKNVDGKLVSLVYRMPCSVNIDPIEKKPLFHLLPGSTALSVGTVGCNLHCSNCQNWEISQSNKIIGRDTDPKEIVMDAVQKKCRSIAYTYTEPTVFYEYALDIAKLAKQKKLKNVLVTNGYINQEPLKKLCRLIDAANVDLKSFENDFYAKTCGGKLEPVLDAIKTMHKRGVWVELTNLIIPGHNDHLGLIEKMVEWIHDELGPYVPLHFSRFFPNYKMQKIMPTDPRVLIKAREIAHHKLHHVYIGNLLTEDGENTHCPKCGNLLVERKGFNVLQNKLVDGKCYCCGSKIKGVWE